MRLEKSGFVLNLEGTWMEISNKYGVQEHGDVAAEMEDIPDGYAEKKLDDFINRHSVLDDSGAACIKKVAFDRESKRFMQIQAVYPDDIENGYWTIQRYDDELVYMGEIWSGCKYTSDILRRIHERYDICSGLPAEVFKFPLGDCTNGGISSTRQRLYILSGESLPFEPEDLRECVYIESRESHGEDYVNCKPVYCQNTGIWQAETIYILRIQDIRRLLD